MRNGEPPKSAVPLELRRALESSSKRICCNGTSQTLGGFPMDPKNAPDTTETEVAEDALVEEELLVEEISIDGMCGVY